MNTATSPRTVSVACRTRDSRVRGVPKYSNRAGWNTAGGTAPNGVSAYRWLRDTSPAVEALSPLARFLFENAPATVAGNLPAFSHAHRVRCYNGKTEADMIRADAMQGRCNGVVWTGPDAVARATERAETLIRCYAGFVDRPAVIDWLFAIVELSQSDTDYWNQEAARILAAGTVRVELNNKTWKK